ncbi:MAG TPA: hypothetical protein VGZ28_15495 [Terriglobales bacterium]|jgi:hypothetical protein|nr:hypothetical protein [Terriglobales bacterium]
MDQPAKIMTSEGADARKWIGRIIMAVILGEAIWSLIVSVMNNLVVPWLGDIMGPSSGVPTSFTQRPYNYPELFVSILELGIAGLVAAVLNYFVQRPTAGRVKPVKRVVPAFDLESPRVIPPAAPAVVPRQGTMTHAALSLAPEPAAPAPPAAKLEPVTPPAPVRVAPEPPVPPAPPVAPAPIAKPPAVATPASPVANPVAAKPLPPPPKAEPAKPKKPREVYYNIVGDPMPSDED